MSANAAFELDLDDGPLVCTLAHDFVSAGALPLAYVFPAAQRVAFATTGFDHPIDQVFIAATGRVVHVFESRTDDTRLGPATDVLVVLELAAGTARERGLMPGAVLRHALFDPASDPGFIAIVQSDRAGWFLACELRQRGYRIIHVHHVRHLDEVGEDEFDVEATYDDDLDAVLPLLHELGPSLVLAGSELGVNPADYLAEALYLPGNGTERSVARRDKAGMVEALRVAGIPVMRQLRSARPGRIARWKDHFGLSEIIIKPVRSAGTDRVARALDHDDIRRAVRAIVGSNNRLGLREVEVVAQERLVGPEIYINSVSRAGAHVVTEIWLETKREAGDAPFAYDTFQLLPGDDVLAGYLREWLVRVLDALGVVWGPAHTEFILTARGPRLIDFGARLDGVLLPALNETCIGKSPVQLAADAYLDPAAFAAFGAAPYRLRQHATMVIVDNPAAGILRDDTGLRALGALPTFHALRPRWDVGEHVPATRDAFSYHAIVTLVDPDLDAVRRDHATIRELEADHLLLDVTAPAPELAPPVPPVVSDPRATTAWGLALANFGWTTHQDGAAIAHARTERDGTLLWFPRQAELDLFAVERLRIATDARRVVIEVMPGAVIRPLVGPPLVMPPWDAAGESALAMVGLTPTMHAQSPRLLDYADAPTTKPEGATIAPIEGAAATFAALGAESRWAAALAAMPGAALAVTDTGAAIGVLHDGVVHVPMAIAPDDELPLLALALGARFAAPVVAPGTGVGQRHVLPPALRWKRPSWAAHLVEPARLLDAVGTHPQPKHVDPAIAARFVSREQPLGTWEGALIDQALGRAPRWARTAMAFRELPGDSPHLVIPYARRVDVDVLDALRRQQRLLWVAWEPAPHHGEVIVGGAVHTLDWTDPARALHDAAMLGFYPVASRWTHRKTFVLDLEGTEEEVLGRLAARRRTRLRAGLRDARTKVTVVTADTLDDADWAAIDALDAAYISAGHAMPHPQRVNRALALAFGDRTLVARAHDELGLVTYMLCVVHDRVAWSMVGNSDPRCQDDNPQLVVRWHLMLHARQLGCDLMDLFGAWDERYPDERTDWRGFTEHKASLHACPIYYPPTLARFG